MGSYRKSAPIKPKSAIVSLANKTHQLPQVPS
uniref:Uncharacterized protein n=1 Tax=Siphoviridae sp. ctxfQ4 TaxID=2826521 RepID=A0A8S5N6P6_9CAUD|nr:MAG TPA: hypothetical protein [Siphoviridae sp. ctxfQ4]